MKNFLNYEIKINKKKLYAGIGVTYIVLTAFLSRGETFYIESDEPLEDVVAQCHWSSSALSGLNTGSHHVTRKKGVIVKSGEKSSCGMNWYAGLTLSFRTYSTSKHPTHKFFYDKQREDGVIIKAKSKLDILDDQKAKFESGYWDKHRNPGAEYLRSLSGCGFPYQYVEYYREVKPIDLVYFKKKYHEDILECHKRRYSIMEKYDPYTFSKIPKLDKRMKLLWENEQWRAD